MTMTQINSISAIETLLKEARFETARRASHRALKSELSAETRTELWLLLHMASRFLGDFAAASVALEEVNPTNDNQEFELLLRRAEDTFRLSDNNFYRTSSEAKAGWTYDQYVEKKEAISREWLEKAIAKDIRAEHERIEFLCKKLDFPEPHWLSIEPDFTAFLPVNNNGGIRGTLRFPDGSPVANAKVTLGLTAEVKEDDPHTYLRAEMHTVPQIGKLEALYTETNDEGTFLFAEVVAGRHEFIAVTLDETKFEIPTRFLLHYPQVVAGETTQVELTVEEWQSAPPREIQNPFLATLERAGKTYRLLHTETHKNPFHFDFPRQLVHFSLPTNAPQNSSKLLLLVSDENTPQAFQIEDGQLYFFATLPKLTDKVWALYAVENSDAEAFQAPKNLSLEIHEQTAIINTGRAQFCLPWGEHFLEAPLLKVRGEDGLWRGNSRWLLPEGIEIVASHAQRIKWGPLWGSVRLSYQLSTNQSYTVEFSFHAGEAYLLAHEISPAIEDIAWKFSLREWGGYSEQGGRGFLHWTPENGNAHWTDLSSTSAELARLQESVPWWIPPAGFGYAMTPDGLDDQDYLGLFTIRRGDWIDREFEKITKGPIDENGEVNRDLDWPFPEMVGSTISMLTAHTDENGDACFRFKLFDGERHWGFLVSTLERNDGPWKEISAVQHKNSSPRLQEFKNWHLDEQDTVERPHVVARRKDLIRLREKRTSKAFASVWKKLFEPTTRGAVKGLIFAVEGDPLTAWYKKRELIGIAPIRSKMTLLGRDYGDMYSPVGGRPITQLAEEYDLIAASGVFTPDEEREVRAFLMLMGHLYMSPDFMNWKNGSRNANFEADRVDVVSAIGLCFAGNPDSSDFIAHTIEGMERAMEVYCTPDSGKWYENPACYYLQAAKCRANLAFHLWRDGHYDVSKLPRFRDFLNWGITLLLPPTPHSYEIMRDGCSHEEYRAMEKVRRLPPIGDHARLGPWVPEHYAFMSLLYRESDPEFAARLMWAYRKGGSDGAYFGNLALYFAALDEDDLCFETPIAPQEYLKSRVLEGFGAIFRGHVEQDNEFYLLLKQGAGGYRYHRTEGSFILVADGKPLVYDGGEAGETWRHSTLSFYDAQMPLAAGHVERFHSDENMDWVSGVHPTIISPDQPIFLSDVCNHELVPVAWQRFREPNPAAIRSVIWVKDEYIVIHDELHVSPEIPSHWHLQVVADSESGDTQNGLVFNGRFGTDLQVLLPDQQFSEVLLETIPMLEYQQKPENCFAQRHLRVVGSQGGYLAILRPLSAGKAPIQAQALWQNGKIVGTHVVGEDIDDYLFFQHDGLSWKNEIEFTGNYGAILRRGNMTKSIQPAALPHISRPISD
jgi:hypothetical protein